MSEGLHTTLSESACGCSSHHLEHVGGNGIDLASEVVVGIENLCLLIISQSLSVYTAQGQCHHQAKQQLGVHLCGSASVSSGEEVAKSRVKRYSLLLSFKGFS